MSNFNVNVHDYDVVLTSSDGTRLGLMLAKEIDPQTGKPHHKAWQVSEIPTPTPLRITSGQGAGFIDLPPEMAAAVLRESFQGGMVKRQILNNETDYFSGCVQSSVTGKIIKPPGTDEITLPTSEGNVQCMIEFGSSFFINDGRYLHKTTDGYSFSQVLDVGAGNEISDLCVYGNSTANYIIACAKTTATGVGIDYYYSTTGNNADWTQHSSATGSKVQHMFVENKTLVGLLDPQTFYTTTDPTSAGTWASPTLVGDAAHNFQGGQIISGTLIIKKQDRVYTVDGSGNVSILIDQFSNNPSTSNFKWSASAFNSNLYFYVSEELWEYDPLAGSLRSLLIKELPDTQIDPSTAHNDGLAYDGNAIYAIQHTNLPPAGNSLVRITFVRNVNGIDQPVYERWNQQTLNGLRPQGPLHFSKLFTTLKTGQHIYFNTMTAGKIARMNLPRAFDPTLDSRAEFDLNDSIMRSGFMTHNFPSELKDYTEVLVDFGNLTGIPPKTYASIYYYLDGDLDTRYTIASGVMENGQHRYQLSNVSGHSLCLEIVLGTDNPIVSPILFSWVIKAAVKFPQREIIELVARISDHLPKRNGGTSQYTAKQIRSLLATLRKTKGNTIRYQDYRGYDISNIRILPGFTEIDAADETKRKSETWLTFKVMRISEDTSSIFVIGVNSIGDTAVIGAT